MDNKIIFIDVDGTLCMPNGEVPDSAKEAIRVARKKGHLCYLCTGRSKPEILDSILEIGFDGIIGAGGGYIEVEEKIVHHQTMPKDSVLNIIQYFHQHNIGYYLESNEGLFGSPNCVEVIRERVTEGHPDGSDAYLQADAEFHWFYDLLNKYKSRKVDYGKVNKISFISSKHHPFEKVAGIFGETFEMYRTTVAQFGTESGEIAVKGVDKSTAIEFVLDYLNKSREQAMAYGDGNNDIKMFEAVDYGVAMENATEELKEIAQEVTSLAEEDGILKSFTLNGLI